MMKQWCAVKHFPIEVDDELENQVLIQHAEHLFLFQLVLLFVFDQVIKMSLDLNSEI